MFWEQFVTLCNQKNISPTAACAELGYSNAIPTKWRKGAMPRNATLHKIADYFGVSVDYLISGDGELKKDTISRIKQLAEQKGIKLKFICEKLGYNGRTYFNDIERNNSTIPNDKLEIIADILGTTVDYLLGNENAPQKATILIPKSNEALTDHEQLVITAYRNQPAMQPAVDKLLGVEQDGEVTVYAAAYSVDKRPDGIISIPKDKWEKIKDAPDTDESLI